MLIGITENQSARLVLPASQAVKAGDEALADHSRRLRTCSVMRSLDGCGPMRSSGVPIGSKPRGEIRSMPKSLSRPSPVALRPPARGPTRGSVPVRKGPASERPDFSVPSGPSKKPAGLPRSVPSVSRVLGHSRSVPILLPLSSSAPTASPAEVLPASPLLRCGSARHLILPSVGLRQVADAPLLGRGWRVAGRPRRPTRGS